MIDYVFIKKNEVPSFTAEYNGNPADPDPPLRFESCKNTAHDDLLAIVAIDKNRVVGRILFTYGYITDNSERIRVTAAQNLFVNEEYRGNGIGHQLIKHSLGLKLPCIHSGLSHNSKQIFKKLGFSFLDESPMFQIPLTLTAVIREARNSLYDKNNSTSENPVSAVLSVLKARTRLLTSKTNFTPLPEDQALELLPELLSYQAKRFQIPWNENKVRDGLCGRSNTYRGVIFTVTDGHTQHAFLVSIYGRETKVRVPMTGRFRKINDGQVNEIYPPVFDKNVAKSLIVAIAKYTKKLGYGNLAVYALTDSLFQACKELGLHIRHNKSIAIQPSGLPKELAEAVCHPEEWWCRIMNEDQLEEASGP